MYFDLWSYKFSEINNKSTDILCVCVKFYPPIIHLFPG